MEWETGGWVPYAVFSSIPERIYIILEFACWVMLNNWVSILNQISWYVSWGSCFATLSLTERSAFVVIPQEVRSPSWSNKNWLWLCMLKVNLLNGCSEALSIFRKTREPHLYNGKNCWGCPWQGPQPGPVLLALDQWCCCCLMFVAALKLNLAAVILST